jgi:hypothetical protein
VSAAAPTLRSRWHTGLAAFCLLTLAVTVPRDLFVAGPRDVEVWLGFELHGAAARATAPIHWAIFAFGGWAAWTAKRWILPAAAGYAFYVALAHLVWSEASPNGHGIAMGLLQAALLSIPGWLLLWAARRQTARQLAAGA